jgi:hypothetical protein
MARPVAGGKLVLLLGAVVPGLEVGPPSGIAVAGALRCSFLVVAHRGIAEADNPLLAALAGPHDKLCPAARGLHRLVAFESADDVAHWPTPSKALAARFRL